MIHALSYNILLYILWYINKHTRIRNKRERDRKKERGRKTPPTEERKAILFPYCKRVGIHPRHHHERLWNREGKQWRKRIVAFVVISLKFWPFRGLGAFRLLIFLRGCRWASHYLKLSPLQGTKRSAWPVGIALVTDKQPVPRRRPILG